MLLKVEPMKDLDTQEIVINVSMERADDPTLEEALASDEVDSWLTAIKAEIESLYQMGVVEECKYLPSGRKAIKCKWVLRRKRDEKGHVAKHKARLVAKGFSQIPGQDFTYTFAPVAKWDSIRLVLALAAMHNWELHHIDVKTAFLNGELEEELYIEKPEIAGKGIWKLAKSLYGLRQASRQWYMKIHQAYTEMGYTRCESDWSVYWRRTNTQLSILVMSVDDILIAANSISERDKVIKEIKERFQISDLGEIRWLLGCRITRNRTKREIKVDQEQYAEAILTCFNDLKNLNGSNSPIDPSRRPTEEMRPKSAEEVAEAAKKPYSQYRELVGKLMYLVTCTRPDLAFATRELAKYMSDYGVGHYNVAKRVCRYLTKTKDLGITFRGQIRDDGICNPTFRAFSDSDWAGAEGRKSVSGYFMELANGPIAWSSKQQAVVALSSCEAEYLATTHAAKQLIWTRSILFELGFPQNDATILYCDNRGTICCTHDPQQHSAMKHIDIRIHFIRDCVSRGYIDVHHIPGIDNYADLCTKALGPNIHLKWLERVGMLTGPVGV